MVRNQLPAQVVKGAGQFDGPKNYEYFEGLVKQMWFIFNTLQTIKSNIKKEEKEGSYLVF